MPAKSLKLFNRKMARDKEYGDWSLTDEHEHVEISIHKQEGEWTGEFRIHTREHTVEGGVDLYSSDGEARDAMEQTLIDVADSITWLRAVK